MILKTDKSKSSRSVELDILRIIATMLVVLGHCYFYTLSGGLDGGIDYFSLLNQSDLNDTIIHKSMGLFSNLIYSCHMALFFFLSGIIYGVCRNKNKYTRLKDLIIDKAKRLIVPYFFVSLFFSVPVLFFTGYFGEGDYIHKILVGYLLGYGKNHLWFVVVLFYIFIILWILDKYISGFVFKSFIIFSMLICSKFVLIDFLYIGKAFQYIIWFYFGYVFNSYRTLFNNMICIYKYKLVIGVLGMWIVMFFIGRRLFEVWVIGYFVTFLGIVFFYSISILIAQKYGSIFIEKGILRIINKYTFEIYLYGTPINYIVLSVIVNTIGVPALSSEIGSAFIIVLRLVFQILIPITLAVIVDRVKLLVYKKRIRG